MTTDTELLVENGVPILNVFVFDGEDSPSTLRYAIPHGEGKGFARPGAYHITARDWHLVVYERSAAFLTVGGLSLNVSDDVARQVAEILLGHPLPAAHELVHDCVVPGCAHGH